MEPRCPWNLLTGTYCPGCGTWRALQAVCELDLAAAFMYNPFLFLIAAPLATYMGMIYFRRRAAKKYTPSIFSSPKAVLPTAAAILCVWILRNVFPPPQ